LTVLPPAVLAAAVLAAEEVSFLLVGSAALWLRREVTTVADADAVIEPGERNIHRLREALASIAIGPAVRSLLGGSAVAVMTTYGKVDCLPYYAAATTGAATTGAGSAAEPACCRSPASPCWWRPAPTPGTSDAGTRRTKMSERTGLGIVEIAILEALETSQYLKCSKALARVEERLGLAPGYAYEVLVDAPAQRHFP
jgi:hypothetical protein